MEPPTLKKALAIFGLSMGVIVVRHRFRIPAIIGFDSLASLLEFSLGKAGLFAALRLEGDRRREEEAVA